MSAKVQAFCKTHAHLLVFCGALIVFTTFVIKEGLGNRWRERADALANAQSTYAIRNQLQYLSSNLYAAESAINKLNKPAPTDDRDYAQRLGSPQEDYDRAKERLRRISYEIADYEEAANTINVLADALPEDDRYYKEATEMNNDINSFNKKAIEIDKTLAMPFEMQFTTGKEEWKKQAGIAAEKLEGELQKKEYGYGMRVNHLGELINQEVLAIRPLNEWRAKWAWRISVLLFTLGWGLGLLGKLYGVPEAAAGD
jgi:hypothetical protein